MAELKVDKILPATGSSIALGESGKTVTIPSGATLDASAATLTNIGARIAYCTSLKTSPFTASASRGYFINTGSAVTVTLPSSPNVGDQIVVIDATGNASSNNITLGRGGSKIKGLCTCATLKTDRVGVRIVYSGSSQGWVTATAANETAPVMDQTLYVTATGGTVTTSGDFKIHTFTSSDNFVVSCAGTPSGSDTVSYLVIAGGGGGGGGNGNCGGTGGGGGAGGYREGKASYDSYTASPIAATTGLPVPAQTYPITIGAGGAAGPYSAPGSVGSNTIFSSITSAGGGFAAGGVQGSPSIDGGNGGSGGGGTDNTGPLGGPTDGGSGNTPPVSPPQGNDGGDAGGGPGIGGSGGGGGATTAGASGSSGVGGSGATSSINNTPTVRAGGGAGGATTGPRSGGPGGGGNSGASSDGAAGTAGTVNTGSGGGGGGGSSAGVDTFGAAGGSGIVIIRYKFQN